MYRILPEFGRPIRKRGATGDQDIPDYLPLLKRARIEGRACRRKYSPVISEHDQKILGLFRGVRWPRR